MSTTVTVGLLPAPGLAETLVNAVADGLPALLAREVDGDVHWQVRIRRDPLIGAGSSPAVLAEAADHRHTQGWDLAVALSDLPLRSGGQVVVADADSTQHTGVVSLPALGVVRLRRRVSEAVTSLVLDLWCSTGSEGPRVEKPASAALTSAIASARRIAEPMQTMDAEGMVVRYAVGWRRGHVKLIAGLVRANQPWQVLGAFKGALAATFATAAYALIFPSAWKLSAAMGAVRPLVIMLLSLAVMVAWIIVAHHLWERPRNGSGNDRGLMRLYNTVTLCTLSSVTAFGYAVLFVVVLFVVVFAITWLFIPLPYFGSELGPSYANVGGYLHLTWLVASLAMLAGALGQGLDDDETVRQATFGYRQNLRARRQQQQGRGALDSGAE